MIPTSFVRHFAAMLASLVGYPSTVKDDLRGRLLG